MSDEFDNLDEREKAAVEGALDRCRALADQIEIKLRNKRPEHFVDELTLADFYASLERAADVLQQKSRRAVNGTPAPAVMGSRTRRRQRHRRFSAISCSRGCNADFLRAKQGRSFWGAGNKSPDWTAGA